MPTKVVQYSKDEVRLYCVVLFHRQVAGTMPLVWDGSVFVDWLFTCSI